MKKVICTAISVLLVVSILVGFASCGKEKKPGPEVGSWYGEVNLSDLDLSDEDKTILSLAAGNVMYEIDVTFAEDNTYSYMMNMDKFREGIQKAANTVLGFFIRFNIDLFVDRIVDMVLDSMGMTSKSNYGSYIVDENGLITAYGTDTQYFRVIGGTLQELDADGNVILTFTKSS